MSYNANEEEKKILDFWKENNSFEKSVEERSEDKPYVFYDGPPFATGLPHYGHIVASTMKDAVPRYWTMQGCRVERKWGWDCHGLPIENMIEKELNLDSKKDIEEYGVDKFNEKARGAVMKYADEWKKIVPRLGRWVDMENDYKTMDKDYMESVWWVFKQLWDKNYVYEGRKPMHICPRCSTPLAQGEVAQGYKEVKDLSVTARFKLNKNDVENNDRLKEFDCDVYILAWTTTPWTLPGNVLLAVGEDITYSLVRHDGDCYLVAKERLMEVFEDKDFEVLKQIQGSELLGLGYEPLFPYFEDVDNAENGFKVVSADFVDTEEGTGAVHIAPAFGEDDYNLYQELENVPFIQHVDMEGKFIEEVEDFAGQAVKTAVGHPDDHPGESHQKADIQIIKWLYHHDMKLFDKQKTEHRYPHCWRCDTPLLNYATRSWFIEVTKVKDKLLENNQKINWVPEHIKDGRFGDWLEGVRDWAVSRNRYWGAPIPIWRSEDGDTVCIGSVEELRELSGEEDIEDLHSHIVDTIEFEKDGKTYHRIPEVFDCWFESGSMPYAQQHYPFENKEKFEKGFPAEFIAEGQDQTRGWFYTLHILSTILTEGEDSPVTSNGSQPAFKNVIVNGMVLAEDGKKMSKSLQNYPDPMNVVEKYGADALRYYLLTSPVMRSEKLSFSEDGVQEVYNKTINMIDNIFNFYSMFVDEVDQEKLKNFDPTEELHVLDSWIISKVHQLNKKTSEGMEGYKLEQATRPIQDFILDLSQWYLRRSRSRMKDGTDEEKLAAISTMRYVFINLFKIMAPFTPFIAEKLYQQVTDSDESVHLQLWPELDENLIDEQVLEENKKVRKLAEMGQSLRQEEGVKVRQALSEFAIGDTELSDQMKEVLSEELNVHNITNTTPEGEYWVSKEEASFKVSLNIEITQKLEKEGAYRELVRNINRMRKKAGLSRDDKIALVYETESNFLQEVLNEYEEKLKDKVGAESIEEGKSDHVVEVKNSKINFGLR